MTNIEQYINNSSCTILPKRVSKYLQEDNFLSEFSTDEEKELAMLNLLLLDKVPTEDSTRLINSGDLYNLLKDTSTADKLYNKESFSGLGRVYLKRNIINNKNILSQEVFSLSNTIYIIQYDYDLNGTEITIPENCVLKFDGGSFSNGTLKLSNGTTISSFNTKIFDNIIIKGGYGIDWDITWFGAKSAKSIDYVRDNNNINKDYLIKDNDTEISHIIQNMINNGCRNIYIPVGIYYWNTDVISLTNLKLFGNFVRAHTWDASTDSYNFSNTGIHILRNVTSALQIGGEQLTNTTLRSSTLEMFGLLFKGVYGSDTTLITGCLNTSHIHDNYIRYIGYFINSLSKSWRNLSFCSLYNIPYDPLVDKPRSGLWVVSRVYNNRISTITHACFKCHISDSTIMYNYISGGNCRTYIDSDGNVVHTPNKTVFFDGSNWDGINASTFSNNYIDYFYTMYQCASSAGDTPNSVYSTNNVYDICSSVISSLARSNNPDNPNDPYDDSYYTKYPTAPSFYFFGDDFIRINNKEYEGAEWTFDTKVPKNQSTRQHFGKIRNETLPGIGMVDLAPVKDGDYYLLDSCYAIFKSIPSHLFMFGCNFKYVDYIFQGKTIELKRGSSYWVQEINILCGKSDMFHFGKFTYSDGVKINIPTEDTNNELFVNFPNTINVTNPKINSYIEETALSLTTEDIKSHSAFKIREEDALLRYINSIPLCNFFNNLQIKPLVSRCFIIESENSYVILTLNDDYIYNLIPNKKYAYYLMYSDINGQVNQYYKYYFNTTGEVRLITLDGCFNVRDIGGWNCLDTNGNIVGTVRYNKIIRGGSLKNISYKGKQLLTEHLYITSEINLAEEEEQIITDLNYYYHPIVLYNTEDNKSVIKEIITDIISILSTLNSLLLNPPCLYVHCLLGRDKTGTLIMLILGLLGVSIDNILKDFDISGLSVSNELDKALNFMKYICDTYAGGLYTDSDYMLGVNTYLLSCEITEELLNQLKSLLIEYNV